MGEETNALHNRVVNLEAKVAALIAEVAQLREQLEESAPATPVKKKKVSHISSGTSENASEEILSWVDKSCILPRIASTSFILAVALALRTASDSNIIDLQIGSFTGIIYALCLIIYGWFAYRKKSIQAPVFTLWGTIVMCAVVVESHSVFATVPTELAYVVMVITGLVGTMSSRINRVALPVLAGTLGMSIGSFAIDYPSPVFPYLVIVMGIANIFATYATRLLRASWLRWLLFFLTLFMVQIWSMRLSRTLSKQGLVDLEFAIQGLLPAIAVLGCVFVGIALLGVLGKVQQRISKFDITLPVLNVCWIFLAGRYVVNLDLISSALFGQLAVVAALAHLAVAWWLAQRAEGGALGTTSFALAGGLLFAFSAPLALNNAVIAMALVALLSGVLFWRSLQLDNLGLRLSSYLLQFYACSGLVLKLLAMYGAKPSLIGALSSGLLATIAFAHYIWARKNPPPTTGKEGFATRLNKNDRGAGVLLIAALFSTFFTFRVGLFQTLEYLQIASVNTFSGGESVLINIIVAVLLLFSLIKRSIELRNVAIIITVIAASKVFLLDMRQLDGIPLMISVFTFGLVAALASLVLSRRTKTPDKNTSAAASKKTESP